MIYDRIMVIDDDVRVAQGIELSLSEYKIIHFVDPFEAIECLKRPFRPSLILLDVYINKINGLDILQVIKKRFPGVIVIIMTGFGTMDVAVQALRHKADDFIEKPFDVKDLREKIRAHLMKKEMGKELEEKTMDKIERIKMFIESNCSDVNLKSLAEILNLTPKYVSRMFSVNSQKKYREYKVDAKIERAKALLKETQMEVQEISESLGYKNAESFMRMFKRVVKLTPSQYRKIANL